MQEEKQNDYVPRNNVECRLCKGAHWTVQCPNKNTLESLKSDDTKLAAGQSSGSATNDDKTKSGKYVPPNMLGGGNQLGESMQSSNGDEPATVRVTNLSEDVRESDLQEMFRPFGAIQRYYIAMDKVTQKSKGFAFVTFHRKEDAAKAMECVSGFGLDHHILNVEWAKPPYEE